VPTTMNIDNNEYRLDRFQKSRPGHLGLNDLNVNHNSYGGISDEINIEN